MSHLEQDIDDKDVEDVFERIYYTVEHSLQFGNAFDCLEWPEYVISSEYVTEL